MIHSRGAAIPGALGAILMIATACSPALLPGGARHSDSSPSPATASGSADASPGSPIIAFDASQKLALALTERALLASHDGGASWSTLPAPSLVGARSILALDDSHVVMTRIDGLDVTVASSEDGGGTWRETTLAADGQPGDTRLAAGQGLLAVLVQQTTSSNFSMADLYVSRDGQAFQRSALPAAGELSVTGAHEVWLAGGVLHNQLWRSADDGRSWNPIPLPANVGPSIGIAPPRRIADQLVLAVTLNGPQTREAWLASGNGGRSWRQVAEVAVGGETGRGVALPATLAGDRVVVAGAAGGLFAASASAGATTPVSPNGLPNGIADLRFASASSGWALATENGCLGFKTACFSESHLYRTEDGGQTWVEIDLSKAQ